MASVDLSIKRDLRVTSLSVSDETKHGGDVSISGAVSHPFETLKADGAASTVGTTDFITDADSTANLAITLADASESGARKTFTMSAFNTYNAVITPDSLNGGTIITFSAAGQSAELVFLGGAWVVTYGIGLVS